MKTTEITVTVFIATLTGFLIGLTAKKKKYEINVLIKVRRSG